MSDGEYNGPGITGLIVAMAGFMGIVTMFVSLIVGALLIANYVRETRECAAEGYEVCAMEMEGAS